MVVENDNASFDLLSENEHLDNSEVKKRGATLNNPRPFTVLLLERLKQRLLDIFDGVKREKESA